MYLFVRKCLSEWWEGRIAPLGFLRVHKLGSLYLFAYRLLRTTAVQSCVLLKAYLS